MGLYDMVFKRTSTFALAVLVGVFFFERGADVAGEAIFDTYNKGKLWKHIKQQYEEK